MDQNELNKLQKAEQKLRDQIKTAKGKIPPLLHDAKDAPQVEALQAEIADLKTRLIHAQIATLEFQLADLRAQL